MWSGVRRQNAAATEVPRVRVASRVAVALLFGCAIVLSEFGETTKPVRIVRDLAPSSEGIPECPEDGSGETDTIPSSVSSTRQFCRRELGSRLALSKESTLQDKPSSHFFYQLASPTRELDNRNGVGAPLRC